MTRATTIEPPASALAAPVRRMLDVISHELRSPLNGIQSWSHVLENELSRAFAEESGRGNPIESSPAAQRALAGIRIGVREQVRLIDQLLDASRAMSGRLTLDYRPLPIVPILESALAGVQPQATARHIALRVDYRCPDCHVEGDADRLRQAVTHLLANAIKFSPEQEEVHVRLQRDAGDILIAVVDHGPGVLPEARRDIFDWFHRGERRQGLGLGLALSQHLVRAHGGDIEVFSEAPGLGATFTIRLPEWRPPVANEESVSAEPASAPPDDRAAPRDPSPTTAPTLPASGD